MPRAGRKKAASGIYHVILRGINRQLIFEEPGDYRKFLEIIGTCKKQSDFHLYAYCLMSNHCHLLIQTSETALGEIMKRIAGKYAVWFNYKYDRTGHLFQDRYKSEPVDSRAYYLTVLRYIHQNPVKSGICQKVGEYSYSSFTHYFLDPLIDTDLTSEVLPEQDFCEFHQFLSEETCMEADGRTTRLSDADARALLLLAANCKSLSEYQLLPVSDKYACLQDLRNLGVRLTQISRITGISVSTIKRKSKGRTQETGHDRLT